MSKAKALKHAVRVSKNPNYFGNYHTLWLYFTLELFSKLYMNMYLITLLDEFPPSYSNVEQLICYMSHLLF